MDPFLNSDSKVSGALADPEHSHVTAVADQEQSGTKPDDEAAARIRWLCRLLETGPQPFAVTDLQQRLVQVNQAFCDLVGYSRQELVGMSTLELTAPQSVELTRRYHTEVLASGKSERVVKEYRRKDGSLVPVELMIDVFRDESGNPVGLYGFVSDITERVKAEEAVRESERRYRELYDEAPVGYYEIDQSGRIKSVNKTACDLLGYKSEELLGRSLLDLIAPSQRDAAAASLRAKFEDATRQCFLSLLAAYEEILLSRDGRELPVEIEEREHRDQDGRIEGLRCVLKDISKRKQTEAALVESERRARALFDGIHDAVLVHDWRGRILDANPAACQQLGYTREELLGMTTSQIDVDTPKSAGGFLERLKCQFQEGALAYEGLHRTKDGRTIPVEITTSTIQFGNQVAVLAILRDITERKALERTQVEFAAAQMRNAEEMETKNRALSESEKRYRQLAEGSLDGIVVADEDGRITLFNTAAEKIFGYEAKEVIGQPLERLIGSVLLTSREHSSSPTECRLGLSPIVGRTVELSGRKKDGT
ncbi:MAG: PAS domain S-box protein, partial [Planctomycetaceae bacterium]|nr:PAS domain S-box protein [Planctomycetaceae bacterium]